MLNQNCVAEKKTPIYSGKDYMLIKNAKTAPVIYYGLHMCEGVAEYREPTVNNGEPYRIFIGEDTIKNMDPTFAGRPVYVKHVDSVNLDNLQAEADGYVVESFFNKADGKHWAKFIVVSDAGHEAIRKGWKLSNAYIPKEMSGGGLWHGVEFEKKVMRGEYEHLAIVPNPRYEESKILTPEEFKAYNHEKELELTRLANDKGEKSMAFNLFKKTKVDNAADFESMSVLLPKSKKEKTISQIINEADEMEMNADKPAEDMMANGDHHVMVGEEKMKVNELVEKHMALKQAHEEMKNKMGGDEADQDAVAAEGKGEGELKPKNGEKPVEKEKPAQNEDEKSDESKKANAKDATNVYFDMLKNAPNKPIKDAPTIDLSMDKVARGKSRYGSK